MRNFRYLDAWHKAHAFTLDIHRITESFPRSEAFGLANTLRRSSANMTTKIAEGCGRDDDQGYVQCLMQSRGIGMEVDISSCCRTTFIWSKARPTRPCRVNSSKSAKCSPAS